MQLINEIKSFNIYEWFFAGVGFALLCLLLGGVGLVLISETGHGNPIIIYPVATLFAVIVMGNLDDNSLTAKETFWGWIIVTFGLAALSAVGIGLITLIKWLSN